MVTKNKVRQSLLNLVHNAVKFTDKGEVTVRIEIERDDAETMFVKLSVKDSGLGLSAESQSRLFQPFVQAEDGIRRKYGGTGLGLSITKKFVDLMNGTIGSTSELNKGSEFWFTIPVQKVSDRD